MKQLHAAGLANRDPVLLVSLVTLAICFAWATGRLTPHAVADTQSYLEYPFGSLRDALTSIRTPGYPIFLRGVQTTVGLGFVPAVQWLIASVAAWGFGVEVQRRSGYRRAGWWAALTILFGCTFLDHQSTISTDAVAASVGVICVTGLLRWVRCKRTFGGGAAVVLAGFTAIMIRPAYLPIIFWVGVMGIVLTRLEKQPQTPESDPRPEGWKRRLLYSLTLAGTIAGLVIGYMTMRWVVVGDFGLVPFGHQNLAGITLQLVSDDELVKLAEDDSVESGSDEVAKLVQEILARRQAAVDRGYDLRPGPGLPTMTMENQWNDLIYQTVTPAASVLWPDQPVRSHKIIGRINRLIVTRYPLRYGHWLLLATRRAIWGVAANLLMNPVFLSAGVPLSLVWFFDAAKRQGELIPTSRTRGPSPSVTARDANLPQAQADYPSEVIPQSRCDDVVTTAALVAFSYAGIMVGFVILTSPPLGRFADAVAILIPAWLAIWISQAWVRFR